MLPHKTKRGAAALERLKVFEGCPEPFDKKKKMVVPAALRVLRLKPGRSYTTVGRLSHEVGWKYQAILGKVEADRIEAGKKYWEAKRTSQKAKKTSSPSPAVAKIDASLASLGY